MGSKDLPFVWQGSNDKSELTLLMML